MKIVIGTKSELKIRALKNALVEFEIESEILSLNTHTGVPDQPFGFLETITGAKNRAMESFQKENPDMAFGIENGLIEIEGDYFDIACIYIKTKDDESVSYSSGYFTPKWVIKEIKEKNIEYSDITKRLSGNSEKDPLKYFSEGKLKREELLTEAIKVALIKIFNKEKY